MGDAIKKLLSYCFVGVLVAGGLFMAGRAYYHSLIYVSTDNAFIEGNVVALAPKVAGHIVALHVVDNQLIKEGDLICENRSPGLPDIRRASPHRVGQQRSQITHGGSAVAGH